MKDYCALTNFPYAVPIELDGVQLVELIPNGYQLPPELWAESLALERQRLDAKAKAELDKDWAMVEAASAGSEYAMMVIRMWRMSGWKPPKSREIKPSTLGDRPVTFWEVKRCEVCGSIMVIRDHRSRCCTPACKAELRKARAARANAKREKIRQYERPCDHCNTEFTPAKSNSRFCSVKCRVANHRRNHRYD